MTVNTVTALHRVLGRGPGPVSDDMIADVVDQQVAERSDLDFKKQVPAAAEVKASDFAKDVAAMRNSGGGTIVYGITETNKRATDRTDVELSETHERTLRQVAGTAITPPVLDLQIDRVGTAPKRCVVISVPASSEPPHLIWRGEFFGAPMRNDADTVWMTERQIEQMYRTRLDRRRDLAGELNQLYARTLRGHATATQAWFAAVAIPRTPVIRAERMTRDQAHACLAAGVDWALRIAPEPHNHPMNWTELHNPHRGLRCWTASSYVSPSAPWRDASVSVGETGAVTLAAAVGNRPTPGRGAALSGQQIPIDAIETALADTLGLLHATARHLGAGDYDLQLGLAWTATTHHEPAAMVEVFDLDPAMRGFYGNGSAVTFEPVTATLPTDVDEPTMRQDAYELALDCVNQCGILEPRLIRPPAPEHE